MKHALRFLTLFVIAALAAAFLAAPALAAPAVIESAVVESAVLAPALIEVQAVTDEAFSEVQAAGASDPVTVYTDGDWVYELCGQSVRLWDYLGSETEVVVPDTVGGAPVVSLCQTFKDDTTIVSVSLPDSVTDIGRGAFYGCTALETVTGGSISTLGVGAFYGCTALTTAPTLSEGSIEIGNAAFYNCEALEAVEGGTIATLGESAFFGCSALTAIPTLADDLTDIPEGAFYNCAKLEAVEGGAVTSLGEYAFFGCEALTAAPTLAEGLTTIPEGIFTNCALLEEISIPDTVTAIEEQAFYGCASLTEMTLPDDLSSIGRIAFAVCTGLTEIDVPDSVTEIGDHAFYPSTTLIVGQGSYAQQWATANSQACTVRGSADLSQEIAPDATTVSAKADAIVATLVSDGMSDYEKALVLHDYLILHTRYVDTHDDYCHTAEAVLLDGYGVCQGYTYAYEALLTRAGITCTTQSGYDHIWNMALLGGEWVHIDCTWDDPVVNGNPELHGENHTYFGITNYALEGIDHHECYDEGPVATSIEQSYAWMTGLLPEKIEELEATIAELVAAGDFHGTVSAPFGGETRSVGLSGDGSGIMGRMIYQGATTPKASLYINAQDALSWKKHPVTVTDTEYDSQKRRMRYDAYAHVPDIDTLVLPHDLVDLQSESFVGSPTDRVILPDALETVGDDVFKNVYAVLEAPEGSFALEYAKHSGLPWQVRPAEEEAVS